MSTKFEVFIDGNVANAVIYNLNNTEHWTFSLIFKNYKQQRV